MSSPLLYLHLLLYLAIMQLVGTQTQAASSYPSQTSGFDRALMSLLASEGASSGQGSKREASSSQGERVDKLASAMGDLYWRNQQPDWLLFQQAAPGPMSAPGPSPRFQRSLAMSELDFPQLEDRDGSFTDGSQFVGLDGPTGGSRNYHALVDEFKQYSRLANPSRESRAFKPKLMSTARGFGKRSGSSSQAGELFGSGGKGRPTLSSKHSDWISQVVSRWPWLDKYINNKYQDYNGNVLWAR